MYILHFTLTAFAKLKALTLEEPETLEAYNVRLNELLHDEDCGQLGSSECSHTRQKRRKSARVIQRWFRRSLDPSMTDHLLSDSSEFDHADEAPYANNDIATELLVEDDDDDAWDPCGQGLAMRLNTESLDEKTKKLFKPGCSKFKRDFQS